MELLFCVFAGIIYGIISWKRYKEALISLPLLFPLYLIKFNVVGIPFSLLEVFTYILMFVFIAKNIKGDWGAILKSIDIKHITPVFLIIIGGVVGTIICQKEIVLIDGNTLFYGLKTGLGILKGWILAPIIWYILLLLKGIERKDFSLLLNSYFVSSVILSGWAIYQFLTKQFITVDARASGPFESGNYLALYITPALYYALWKLSKFKFKIKESIPKKEILFFVIGVVLISLGLLFSKCYTAMAALAVVVCLNILMRGKKFLLGGVIVALTLLIAGLVVYKIDPGKWDKMFNFNDRNSSSVRLEVYTIDFYLLQRNWLLGIGLGQYPAKYQLATFDALGHAPYEYEMLHPHNLYLAFWLNLGVLGIFALIIIIINSFWNLRNLTRDKDLVILGIAMFSIILIHGIFDTPFFKNDLAYIFWLTVFMSQFKPKVKDKYLLDNQA